MHRLIGSLAVCLLAAVACHDLTRGNDYRISSHTLSASTVASGDSIECQLFSVIPLPDSIQAPWSGTAPVLVRRMRMTAGFPSADTTLTNATVTIEGRGGDSLEVHIDGGAHLALHGRLTYRPYEAGGTWRCDDTVPLAKSIAGEATGHWSLTAVRYID